MINYKKPTVNMRISIFLIAVFAIVSTAQAQNDIWKMHVIDASHSGADGVRLADVNDDGLMDITTGWEEGGYTKIYLNPGYDKVRKKWPTTIVGKTPSVEDAVFADLNGDGAIDVISSTEGENRKVYINWAPENEADYLNTSSWKSEVIPTSNGITQWMFALPLQIDAKNGLDIVVGSKGVDAKIGWFEAPENPENLSDWKWHFISPATWTMSLFGRDMDNDGDLDIITSDRKPGATNGVRWLENPGAGASLYQEWKNHLIGARNKEVMFMDLADLDEDSLEDAICTQYTNQKIIYMRRLDHSGLKWENHEIDIPSVAGRAKAVKVGDINNDGKPDIVLSTNTLKDSSKVGLVWLSYYNSPLESVWETHSLSGPLGYKFDRIELIDLDGDGDLDVLTCEENYGANSYGLGVIWYENPHAK
ncbi:MAG: VCBS repeat-containing protein [Cyclobacteriaceae bacterium]